jgi:hypothetical protein
MNATADLETQVRGRLEELFLRKLAAGPVDLVSFVDEILVAAHEAGGLECTLGPERQFRFRIPGCAGFEIKIERALGRLRTICARLSAISQESGHDVSPYGGEGVIRRTLVAASNGTPAVVTNFQLRFHNTTGQQDFALTAQ